jgi:hypothetical protein
MPTRAADARPTTAADASGRDLPNESSGPSGTNVDADVDADVDVDVDVTVTARPTPETSIAARARVSVPSAPVRPPRPVHPVRPVRSKVEAGPADTSVASRRLPEQPPEIGASGARTSPAHRVGMGP